MPKRNSKQRVKLKDFGYGLRRSIRNLDKKNNLNEDVFSFIDCNFYLEELISNNMSNICSFCGVSGNNLV